MSEYFANKMLAAQDIIRDILFDSIVDLSDYRNWLDNISGLESDKQVISSYLFEGDTASARSLLNLIPSLYSLEGEDLDDFNDYKDLIELQISWIDSGKTIHELDSLDLIGLEDYAVDGSSTAGIIAKNILTYAYNYHFCDCMHKNDSIFFKKGNGIFMESQNQTYKPKISVEPNPARAWTVFKYELPDEQTEGVITIMDLSGKRIDRFIVYGTQGEKVWDLRFIKPGMYFYTFSVHGITNSGKILIN